MYKIVNKVFEIINNISPIIIMSPNHRSFGNSSEEILYGILLAQKLNKKILFLFPRIGILSMSNRELFYLEHKNVIHHKNYLSLIMGILFEIYVLLLWSFNFFKTSKFIKLILEFINIKDHPFTRLDAGYVVARIGINLLWIPNNNKILSIKDINELNWPNQYKNYIPPKIGSNKIEVCRQKMKLLGLPDGAWFVCFHVREKLDPSNARQSYVETYTEAIKYITSKGGWVIRIGEKECPEIKEMNNFIDYAKSKHKSNLLDLFIISECRFFFGTGSGPNSVANLFNKDAYAANLVEWSHSIAFHKKVIFKHFYSKEKSRILSIKEMLNEPFHIQIIDSRCHHDYKVVDNTSKEIKVLVQSALKKFNSEEVSKYQDDFNKIKMEKLFKNLEDGKLEKHSVLTSGQYLVQQYRFMALSMFDGKIEKYFLDTNWIKKNK